MMQHIKPSIALYIIVVVLASAMLTGCSREADPQKAEASLEAMLRKAVSRDKGVRNAVLLVEAPDLGISGTWSAGIAYEQNNIPMTNQTPFLSASVGKLFTASLVFSLIHNDMLSLDDSITQWLDDSMIAGLPIAGGDPALHDVTMRQLLGHRSGLPDYFEGETKDGAPNVFELLKTEPERAWTPILLLDYLKVHFDPAGAPGEVFLYSDTNYDLLGLIAEAAGGGEFHELMDQHIIVPIGLQNTWMHTRSQAPYADVWIGDVNAAQTPALSLDWAGGGLATTAGDLLDFMRSLLEGRPVPISAFQTDWTENAIARGIDYGYGLWRIRPGGLFFLLKKYPELIGVSGSSGSFLYWVPAYNAVIAGTFNQTDYQRKHVVFLINVLKVLNQAAAD
jgi:D-alanyl-D-alanine carboxypeptidase